MLFLGLFAQPAFVFLLGEKWRMTGLFIQILLPYFFFRFISTPINVFVQTGKTYLLLIWQIIFFSLTVSSLLTGKIFQFSPTACVILLSVSNSLSYFILMILNMKITGAKFSNILHQIIRIIRMQQ